MTSHVDKLREYADFLYHVSPDFEGEANDMRAAAAHIEALEVALDEARQNDAASIQRVEHLEVALRQIHTASSEAEVRRIAREALGESS